MIINKENLAKVLEEQLNITSNILRIRTTGSIAYLGEGVRDSDVDIWIIVDDDFELEYKKFMYVEDKKYDLFIWRKSYYLEKINFEYDTMDMRSGSLISELLGIEIYNDMAERFDFSLHKEEITKAIKKELITNGFDKNNTIRRTVFCKLFYQGVILMHYLQNDKAEITEALRKDLLLLYNKDRSILDKTATYFGLEVSPNVVRYF